MVAKFHAPRFLIQLERPGLRLDMNGVREVLEGTEVELDPDYGPILVNPKLGRYVVRGYATPHARAKAESLPGITFFADVPVEPLKP
jgi:hypothetical protein